MPLFDFSCDDCGQFSELLVTGNDIEPKCKFCGSQNLKKQLSAHSSISGIARTKIPGLKDSTCCGSSPNESTCAGPGSCCGKTIT